MTAQKEIEKLESGMRVMVYNQDVNGEMDEEGIATLVAPVGNMELTKNGVDQERWQVEFDNESGYTYDRWVSVSDLAIEPPVIDPEMPEMSYRIEPGVHGGRDMARLIIRGTGDTGVCKQIEMQKYAEDVNIGIGWKNEMEALGYKWDENGSREIAKLQVAATDQAEDGKRPDGVTDEHLEYLDDLRDSGATNMFGAGRYLEEEFCFTSEEAKRVLLYWMSSYGKADR